MTVSPIRIHSYAKINLALAVMGKRPDGYHAIQTVFQSISLCDDMEFMPSDRLTLECRNLPEVPVESNLVWKAAVLISGYVRGKHGAQIILKKRIPWGAGLGGGSSNAAVTLLALCRLWHLDLSESELLSMAMELGSDVPFFLMGGTVLGSGRGEILQPLEDFPSENLVVLYPGVQVSTADAYSSLNLGLTSTTEDNKILRFLGQIEKGSDYLTGMFNDFEAAVLSDNPPISKAGEFLRQQGAAVTLLSGSGSAVFGFFPSEESSLAAVRAATDRSWQVFPAKTLSRTEYFQSMFG